MIVKLIIQVGKRYTHLQPKPFLMILIMITWPVSQTNAVNFPIGARALGMGSTYVALANTADALFLNPAGLSQIQGTEVSFFYQKPFGINELNFATGAISFPIRNIRLNLGYAMFGNNLYAEQHFKIAYSQNFAKKIFYGVGINFQNIQIQGNGSAGAFLIDLGLVVPLTKELRLGFTAKNLNRSKIGKSQEKLPQSFNTGLSLKAHPSLILNMEIFKDIRFEQEFRLGVEIKAHENLSLRTGTVKNPNRFSAGFGVNIKPIAIDYAFFTHNDLGLTHQLSLSINFAAAEKARPEIEPVIANRHESSVNQNQAIAKATININTATIKELKTLPGIGEKLAHAIISYREAKGLFLQIDDLKKVEGIGAKTLEKIKPYIIVQDIAIK